MGPPNNLRLQLLGLERNRKIGHTIKPPTMQKLQSFVPPEIGSPMAGVRKVGVAGTSGRATGSFNTALKGRGGQEEGKGEGGSRRVARAL